MCRVPPRRAGRPSITLMSISWPTPSITVAPVIASRLCQASGIRLRRWPGANTQQPSRLAASFASVRPAAACGTAEAAGLAAPGRPRGVGGADSGRGSQGAACAAGVPDAAHALRRRARGICCPGRWTRGICCPGKGGARPPWVMAMRWRKSAFRWGRLYLAMGHHCLMSELCRDLSSEMAASASRRTAAQQAVLTQLAARSCARSK
mmetsp:Transcript_24255/g.70000  ORF Transcript_24255/g.70000 Transcript_24255/m.70000 type:complete len:207 (-) Transcript_24255:254-874(-)